MLTIGSDWKTGGLNLCRNRFSQFAPSNVDGVDYTLSSVNAIFNVHVYPLDLAEDCNCPYLFKTRQYHQKKGFYSRVTSVALLFANAKGIQEVKFLQTLAGRGESQGWNRCELEWFSDFVSMVAYEYTTPAKLEKSGLPPKNSRLTMEIFLHPTHGISGMVRMGFRFNAGRRRIILLPQLAISII